MTLQREVHEPEAANFDDTGQTQGFFKAVIWKCCRAAPITWLMPYGM